MDSKVEEIVLGLHRLLKGAKTSFIAVAKEDKEDTVDVEDLNGTKYIDVRKIATQGIKGMIPKVKKESFVIVSRIAGSDDLYVSMYSEIEGVVITAGETTVEFNDKGEITFNGGKNNGLVKVEKLTDKINAVEKNVNDLRTAISAWVIKPQDGGAALKTSLTSWLASMLVETQQTEIENDKIKH